MTGLLNGWENNNFEGCEERRGGGGGGGGAYLPRSDAAHLRMHSALELLQSRCDNCTTGAGVMSPLIPIATLLCDLSMT